MKFVLEFMEKHVRPLFLPGGWLHKLYPVYEAGDTFLFTPPDVTPGPPHVRDALDLKRYMITVCLALAPCILFGIFNAGYQYNTVNQVAEAGFLQHVTRGAWIVLPIIFVSYAVGGFWEVLFAVVRKHEINEGFLVTGMLFPLTLPPTIPLWQVALGISFGVVIGKEIFGGTGFNVLNPALTARCFLYFAYPAQISGDKVWTVLKDPAHVIEGFTGATALAVAKAAPAGVHILDSLRAAGFTWPRVFFGLEPGSIGETSAFCALLGAVVLILSGVGAWRTMAGGALGLAATMALVNRLPIADQLPAAALPFWYEMAMGGVAFGIIFMATDPVSSAATNAGKWIYGFLIGFLTIVIRLFNPAFTAGNMLAILFCNVLAPLIDHLVVQTHLAARRRHLRAFRHA